MALSTSLIETYGSFGILISSFLSYSVIPIPSEPILLVGIIAFPPSQILLLTLLGGTLGSVLNYYLGLKGVRLLFFKKRSGFDKKAHELFVKYGGVSIVALSWLPILGDPLIIAAGTFRMRFWKFLIYSIIGKLWYFALVLWTGSSLIALF